MRQRENHARRALRQPTGVATMTSSGSNYRLQLTPLRSQPFGFLIDTSTGVNFTAYLMPRKWVLTRLSECCGEAVVPVWRDRARPAPGLCQKCEQPLELPASPLPWDGLQPVMAQGKHYAEWPYLPTPEEWLTHFCELLLPPLEANAVAWALHERLGELCAWLEPFSTRFEAAVQASLESSSATATYDAIEEQERRQWLAMREELFLICSKLSQKALHPHG